MPLEMLFEKTQSMIFVLILIFIGAIIMLNVMNVMGIFEKKQVPYTLGGVSPEVMCIGDRLAATFSLDIETHPQAIDIMPILSYHGAIGYNESNVIHVDKGKGSKALSFSLALGSQRPTNGQPVWLALTLWGWSRGGCLNQTLTVNPAADYSAIVQACAEDFILSQTINSSSVSGC